jgi:hypothetical protein
VIVAVVRVRVVQMTGDEVVDMVAMRNRLVTTTDAVDVAAVVALAGMLWGTPLGVLDVDLEHVLVDVITVRMMQVALVQVVEMIAVRNGRVAAAGPVLVGMVWVRAVLVHVPSLHETRISRQAAESKKRSHPSRGPWPVRALVQRGDPRAPHARPTA